MIESYSSRQMIARLQRALGMCPAHTRHLLSEASSRGISNFVYLHICRVVSHNLELPPSEQAECPVCESRRRASARTTGRITASLIDPAITKAYAGSDGLCMAHLLEALPDTELSIASPMLQRLRCRLENNEGWMALFAGWDGDVALRRELRDALPHEEDTFEARNQAPATLYALRKRFRIAACPICLAVGRMELRYLSWVGDERKTPERSLDGIVHMCRAHTHDLAVMDAEAGHWLLGLKAARWRNELGRFTAELESLPPASLLARVRALPGAWWRIRTADARGDGSRRWLPVAHDVLATLRASPSRIYASQRTRLLNSTGPCMVCKILAVTDARERRLLIAALQDGHTARCFEDSSGVCLHHLMTLISSPVSDLLFQVARARLAVLLWELEEGDRKRAWVYRHEARGAETTAWLRVPGWFDGRVYAGGPARDLRTSAGKRQK